MNFMGLIQALMPSVSRESTSRSSMVRNIRAKWNAPVNASTGLRRQSSRHSANGVGGELICFQF